MSNSNDNDSAYKKQKEAYKKYAETVSKKSRLFRNCICAFITGGAICTFGQLLQNLFLSLGADDLNAPTLVSLTLIFLSVLFTGIGSYDKLAKHAGAGTLVPITGFANAVTAPAIDAKKEGYVTGVGAKIFTVAGPVILFGTLSSVIYGILYWALKHCL